ncbi:MAG: signal peptidase II [Clostridia bacterium]|nr:signal peptidase II [Clostridia bacterium]
MSAAIVAIGVLLDQLSKYLAVRYLAPVFSRPLLRGVVDLTYVENRGAAFGMLAEHRWVFMVISTVAILGMCAFLLTFSERRHLFPAAALSMIISGGVGNMIDRVRLGYVVDMIDVSPLFDFAVFNVADSFVCVGAALLILWYLLDWIREEKENKRRAAETEANAAEAATTETETSAETPAARADRPAPEAAPHPTNIDEPPVSGQTADADDGQDDRAARHE